MSITDTNKQKNIANSYMCSLRVSRPGEEAHSRRVSELCEKIGYAYDLNPGEIDTLKIAADLHDIGKIYIDTIILNKEDKLSECEWVEIKKHPHNGYQMLHTAIDFGFIASYVLSHHERWDGKGYPRGLKGKEIDWRARVISVADSYDAMTSDRPYRKALTPDDAAEEIRLGAGSQFDPDVARAFIENVLGLEW